VRRQEQGRGTKAPRRNCLRRDWVQASKKNDDAAHGPEANDIGITAGQALRLQWRHREESQNDYLDAP
jgi:hypothetical protein